MIHDLSGPKVAGHIKTKIIIIHNLLPWKSGEVLKVLAGRTLYTLIIYKKNELCQNVTIPEVTRSIMIHSILGIFQIPEPFAKFCPQDRMDHDPQILSHPHPQRIHLPSSHLQERDAVFTATCACHWKSSAAGAVTTTKLSWKSMTGKVLHYHDRYDFIYHHNL